MIHQYGVKINNNNNKIIEYNGNLADISMG